MVKKTIGTFSIYKHVNQPRQRRGRFVVEDSPPPSSELQQDKAQIYAQQSQSPPMSNINSNNTNIDDPAKCGNNPLLIPGTDPPTMKSTTQKLITDTATPRKTKHTLIKSKQPVNVSFLPSSEAEEAPPHDEIDLCRRGASITRATLRPSNTSPQVTSDCSEAKVSQFAPKEVYGYEHRAFFLGTKRSLRGRTTTDINHSGAKVHVTRPEEFYDMCDTDELFSDGSSFTTAGKLTPKRAKIATEGTTTARRKTRSTALPSDEISPAVLNLSVQSDVEVQQFFAQWTCQLVKKIAKLKKHVETVDKQADEFRDVISVKDDNIDKLHARIKDLRRKSSLQYDTQVLALKEEVANLRTQVATANALAQENKELVDRQNIQLAVFCRSKAQERTRFEEQIQNLRHQLSTTRSKPFQSPVAAPPPMLAPRSFVSPLSRAIGRYQSCPATREDHTYETLEAAAKEVVARSTGLMGREFGPVGVVLAKLKQAVEELKTKKEG